jgi:4-hydroxymandelate oxidase
VAANSVETDPVNLFEFEERARRLVGQMAYDYFASGANDEITLRENRQAFERIVIYPRMLRDVSGRSTITTAMGQAIQSPIMVAPMAFQKMAHADGELAMARAASDEGTIMVLSTLSTYSIEDVAAASDGNLWFQLYVYKDREITASLVRRAEAAGCKALVLTVDSPILGRREKDVRNGFHLPEGIVAANLASSGIEVMPGRIGDSGLAHYIASLYDQSLSWKDVEWLRGITKLPLLVKGILRADDAELALAHGAAGIIVSNHGGRQLDTAPATINVLARVAEVVGGRAEVFLDGGIRRGTDVLKALALGAKGVFVGRPLLWGLANDGEKGAANVLRLLQEEFSLAMALSGCGSLEDLNAELLAP